MNEYIKKRDMLDAAEKLDIIPSVDGMGNPTDAEDFRVQFLGTVLKVEPADVAPVVHAYWIDTDNYYRRWRCSTCSGHTKEAHPPFCPFCGAKMDGKEQKQKAAETIN